MNLLPSMTFRGDSRSPYEIFSNGFMSRGGNNNIQHVQGDRAGNSNYISTSGTLNITEPFALSQGMRNLESAGRQERALPAHPGPRKRQRLQPVRGAGRVGLHPSDSA
ncbi:hypothetical protein HLK59_26555 [Streptomyces sp. S3(2020)]|nr:hypothetical protein [Streptomyces sp. S3(2020)]